MKEGPRSIVGLLEWSESGQTAATTFVCFLYGLSTLFIHRRRAPQITSHRRAV